MRTIAILVLAAGCGEPVDDPSAYTEFGIPDARWQLGWSEQDVPWDALSVRERATVLRKELVVLRAEHGKRERARGLLQELKAVPLTNEVAATPELERLRLEVRALKASGES